MGSMPTMKDVAQETAVDLLLTKDRSNIPAMVLLPVAYAPGGGTRE